MCGLLFGAFIVWFILTAIQPVLGHVTAGFYLLVILYGLYYANFTDEGREAAARKRNYRASEQRDRKLRRENGYNSFTEWKRYKSAVKHGRPYRGFKDPRGRW